MIEVLERKSITSTEEENVFTNRRCVKCRRKKVCYASMGFLCGVLVSFIIIFCFTEWQGCKHDSQISKDETHPLQQSEVVFTKSDGSQSRSVKEMSTDDPTVLESVSVNDKLSLRCDEKLESTPKAIQKMSESSPVVPVSAPDGDEKQETRPTSGDDVPESDPVKHISIAKSDDRLETEAKSCDIPESSSKDNAVPKESMSQSAPSNQVQMEATLILKAWESWFLMSEDRDYTPTESEIDGKAVPIYLSQGIYLRSDVLTSWRS